MLLKNIVHMSNKKLQISYSSRFMNSELYSQYLGILICNYDLLVDYINIRNSKSFWQTEIKNSQLIWQTSIN